MTITIEHPVKTIRIRMCRCGCGGPGDEAHGMCTNSYNRYRNRQIAYGRWQPRVPATAARHHVTALINAGLRLNHIAAITAISKATVYNVLNPATTRIYAKIEEAILAVEIPNRPGDIAPDNALVPILGARRRIQALIAAGYPQAHLARALGMSPAHTTMAALVGRPNLCSGATGQYIGATRDRAVKTLFDRLQLIPGPSNRARAYGQKRNWPLPLEWDEDTIDQPTAAPISARWTPDSARAERRAKVQAMTAAGKSAEQIAAALGIATRTVQRDRALEEA